LRVASCEYIGVSGDLASRVQQHRTAGEEHFCGKYRIHRLVHVEEFKDYATAIRREKQLKGWRRSRKLALIEETNPEWQDMPQS
jgi:putative endonuclease